MAVKSYGLTLVFLLALQDAVNPGPPQTPPPPPGPRDLAQRIEQIRTRLKVNPPAGEEQRELEKYVHEYLDDAVRALNGHRQFRAERFADAGDACRRPIDHLQHIASGRSGPRPPGNDLADQLRQVYFRLKLCDFFLQEIPPPAPKRLLELSRAYYERATHAQQQGNQLNADEYAKAANDLTHCLESLAQAFVPEGSK